MPRVKGRDTRRIYEASRPPAPIPPVTLDETWTSCHICNLPVEAGTKGVWSQLRKNWRHAGCVAPLPETKGAGDH